MDIVRSNLGVFQTRVIRDGNLSSIEKLLLIRIQSLSCKTGFCYASNAFLGECLNISPKTVSKHLTGLSRFGYITRYTTTDDKKQIISRAIKINYKKFEL